MSIDQPFEICGFIYFFSHSVFNEEVDAFPGLQTVKMIIDFVNHISVSSMAAEKNHTMLIHCLADFHGLVRLSFVYLLTSQDLQNGNYIQCVLWFLTTSSIGAVSWSLKVCLSALCIGKCLPLRGSGGWLGGVGGWGGLGTRGGGGG